VVRIAGDRPSCGVAWRMDSGRLNRGTRAHADQREASSRETKTT